MTNLMTKFLEFDHFTFIFEINIKSLICDLFMIYRFDHTHTILYFLLFNYSILYFVKASENRTIEEMEGSLTIVRDYPILFCFGPTYENGTELLVHGKLTN